MIRCNEEFKRKNSEDLFCFFGCDLFVIGIDVVCDWIFVVYG